MNSAYCPWCGVEMSILSVFQSGDIEWDYCKTQRCRGNFMTVIADSRGFVIHPNHIRGRYVYVKPNSNGGQSERNTKNNGQHRRYKNSMGQQ